MNNWLSDSDEWVDVCEPPALRLREPSRVQLCDVRFFHVDPSALFNRDCIVGLRDVVGIPALNPPLT